MTDGTKILPCLGTTIPDTQRLNGDSEVLDLAQNRVWSTGYLQQNFVSLLTFCHKHLHLIELQNYYH